MSLKRTIRARTEQMKGWSSEVEGKVGGGVCMCVSGDTWFSA